MAKRSLYFNKTTKTTLATLPDALNRELQKDDFVTAVFSDGELTLFKIAGFERHKIEYFMDYAMLDYDQDKGIVLNRTSENEYIVLQRVQGTDAYAKGNSVEIKKFNSKLIFKTSKQVAYADPNFVMLHFFTA